MKSVIFLLAILAECLATKQAHLVSAMLHYVSPAAAGGSWHVPLPSGNNMASIKWTPVMRNGEELMLFSVEGPADGYLAMAISEDRKMGPADDAYVCSRTSPSSNSVKISSAYLTGHNPPTIVSPVDNGHVVNASIDDNRMSCTFLRSYSVTKKVDGKSVTWDISTTKYNLLFAEGQVTDDGNVTYHDKNKNATLQPINFTNQTIPNDNIPDENIGGSWNVPLPCGTNCASVQWKPVTSNGTEMMMFTLKGPSTGYIAMAISSDMKMGPADDAYVCSRTSPSSNSVKISSAYLTGHKPPTLVSPVDNGHVVNASIDDNRMSCTFLRPYSVTKKVDGKPVTWDISTTKYNILFAEGQVTDDGNVTYHDKNKNATLQPINFTNQTIPDDNIPDENIGGSWNVPLPCGTNCASVQWKPVTSNGTEMMMFTLKGPSTGYIAMAISSDMKMGPSDDAYVCSRTSPSSNSVKISSAYLTGHKPPTLVSPVDNGHVVNASIDDNRMSCTFLRPYSVTKKVDGKPVTWDISTTKYNLLFAEGQVTDDGNVTYHDKNKNATQQPINFTNQTIPDDNIPDETIGGSWNVPLPCGTNCASVQWKPVMSNGTEMMMFTLKGPSTGYIAMAISSDMKMGPADDTYVCSRSSPSSYTIKHSSAYLTGHKPPTLVTPVDNGHLVNTSIDDNRMSCAFLRPYSVTKEVDGKSVTWDISTTKYNLLFAEGPVTDDGDVTYHDKNKNATQQPINFTNQTIPNESSTTSVVVVTTISDSTQVTTDISTTSASSENFASAYLLSLLIIISVFQSWKS